MNIGKSYCTDNNKEIQEFLFQQGYKWSLEGREVTDLKYKYIHIGSYENLTRDNKQCYPYLNNEDFKKLFQPETKMQITDKKICIEFNDNNYDIVLSLLKGFEIASRPFDEEFKYIWLNWRRYGEAVYACNENQVKFDYKINPDTELGKLIEILKEKPVPVIKIKNKVGEEYTAKFKKDYVVFGCAKIDNNLFKNIINFGESGCIKKDSKYITAYHIGNGIFPVQDIENIVNHPYFNKGE